MFSRKRSRFPVHRLPCEALLGVVLGAAALAICSAGPTWGYHLFHRAQSAPAQPKAPPLTRTDNVKEVLHDVEIVDPYRWLEDQNSPETRAWIDAQNDYTKSVLELAPGRDVLRLRLTALLKVDVLESPMQRNGRYFFLKRLATQDQPVLYMRRGLYGADEPLIDPIPMSPDHTTTVSLRAVSDDGALLAYAIRQGGADEVEPRLFDVNAHKDLPDRFPQARYSSIELDPSKKFLYFTRMTPEGGRVFSHRLGADPSTDVELFGKGYGPEKIIVSKLAEDGRYIAFVVLYGSAANRTEVYLKDLAAQGSPVVPIVNDVPARFIPELTGDRMFLFTNWQAARGRILGVDLHEPARDHWVELVPEKDAVIEEISLVGHRLAVQYTQNASSRVSLYEPAGKFVREIVLPAIGSATAPTGRWNSPAAFFSFESYHMPRTIYRYDVATGAQEVWARTTVPLDSSKFEVKQVWYTSKDGTRVPMFLTYAKGLKLDESNPTLLTGYGGFNLSETPTFTSRCAAWILSGGVYAVANLRGGGEFGEDWHHAGMLANKQHVFDDFIAAAEWLITNHYTRSSRLAIRGSSNGGLLMGAAITQQPNLFGAVACGYPLLDMLRYDKFLVARWWVPEYGSANDPEQFKFIYAYSPYQHVKPGTKYPPVLFITGDSDTRVAPLHARKMAARVQAATASGKPVLLHYDTKAGHFAGAPISKQVDDLTDELSFLFWQLDVSPASPNR